MNSLSLSDSKGYIFSACDGVLNILKTDGPRLKGRRVGRMYRLNVVTYGAAAKHGSNVTGRKQSGRGARRRTDAHEIGIWDVAGLKLILRHV